MGYSSIAEEAEAAHFEGGVLSNPEIDFNDKEKFKKAPTAEVTKMYKRTPPRKKIRNPFSQTQVDVSGRWILDSTLLVWENKGSQIQKLTCSQTLLYFLFKFRRALVIKNKNSGGFIDRQRKG